MVDPTPVPTKKTDPTLGIAAHIGAVAAGALAGYASTKLGLDISSADQADIAIGIATVVTTGVHFLQAKFLQVKATM